MCMNTNCTSSSEFNLKPPMTEYSIMVAVSDYTDTLRGCYLYNSTAENLLHINIKKQGFGQRLHQVRIIHCTPLSTQELTNHYQQQLKDLHLAL